MERGALVYRTFYGQNAAVIFDNAVNDGETQSCSVARSLGCEEWLKNTFLCLIVDTFPVVKYGEPNIAVL